MAKKRRRSARSEPAAPAVKPAVGAAAPELGRWLPAGLFLALTVILFRDFIFSDRMLVGNDTLSLGYVARSFYADALTELGTFPRWAPLILGGTPFLEALSGGDALYPPSALLLLLTETYRALGWKLVLHVLGAGFFMYGWTRVLGASRAAALVAGVGYMLAPFLVSLVRPGHDGKIFVAALAPLLFWAVEKHFLRSRVTSFAGIAAVVALVISTTHFQMAYFLFGAVGLYAIFRTVELWRGAVEDGGGDADPAAELPPRRRPAPALSRLGVFLAASVVGAGIAGVQFIPAVGYVMESSRRIQTTREAAGESGVAWSSSWSLHPEEAMSMLIPEFAGNDARGSDWSQSTYWGRNVTRDNSPYAGIVIMLLAAVSFAGGARVRLRYFFVGLAALAFLFALGSHTPVWRIFYEVVPGIRLFRAPDQVMFLFGFGAATLAALGTDRILRVTTDDDALGWKQLMRVLWIAGAVMAVLALAASSGGLTSVWTGTVYRDIDPGRLQLVEALQPLIGRGAWIAAFLALATAGLTWTLREGYLAPRGLVAGVVLLVAVDELRISTAFVQVMDFHQWAQPDPNVQTLLDRHAGDPEPYRLWSLLSSSQDVKPALHGIELAAGHHPNDLSRYRELIGMVGSGQPVNLANDRIRRLLNVRYILWPDWERGPAPEGPVVSRSQFPDGSVYATLLAADGLPRARLVGGAVVRSDAEAVAYMLSEGFDPEREVVLAEEPPLALDGTPVQGTVRWEERGPNRMRLAVRADRPALLVVADNWYPAWHATVDGADTPVLRAYHTLRAVPIPGGDHVVEMEYRSTLVARGLVLSVALLLGLAGAVGWQLRRDRAVGRES